MMAAVIDSTIKERSKLSKEEWKEYTKTVWSIANVSDRRHPAIFPDEIPKRLTKLFSFWGESVLDPFGGLGTTASVAASLGRYGISVDQSAAYNEIARDRCRELAGPAAGRWSVRTADCRRMRWIKDNSISLIVSSPPYWDKARYIEGVGDIGAFRSYDEFLQDMKQAFEEFFRVLQPGRKICINTANVNQNTEHGLLTFPIPADFMQILRSIGFVMVNEIIWSKDRTGGRWGSANKQRPIFGSYPYPPNFLFKNVHEHILIFAKPDGKKRNGKTARKYTELMGSLL